jgi:type VI secretion system protein ImpK
MSSGPPIDDPFAQFDGGRTFVKPNPGVRTQSRPAAALEAAAPDDTPPPEHGLNPLLALANPLLQVAPQLRQTRHVADVEALRRSLSHSIRAFATSAGAAGITPERVMAARYVMCTMLDEAAADTPWGGSGVWARQSLLASFHNEAFGGEKVFQLMARLAENPGANRDLLELIYAALALGFEGRYRIVDNGAAQLQAVRDKLAQILKRERGDYAPALAQHWAGQALPGRRAASALPLAAAAAVLLLLMAGAYLGFAWSLAGRSDPVLNQIHALRLAPPVATVVQAAPQPRLALLLQPDVKAGTIEVRDEVDRSVVTLRGDGLFAPASAALAPDREALMGRVAGALAKLPGSVLVTGHTDAAPIRSARFPSNWHLSEERARTVGAMLVAGGVAAARVRAEGRADGEPAVASDPRHPSNRRVEVTLIAARSDAVPLPGMAARPAPAAEGAAPAASKGR